MDEVVKSRNPHSDPGFQLALAEILNNYSFFCFCYIKTAKMGWELQGIWGVCEI